MHAHALGRRSTTHVGVDLIDEVSDSVDDARREPLDDDVLEVLDVLLPARDALGDLEHAVGARQQLGDLLAWGKGKREEGSVRVFGQCSDPRVRSLKLF